MAAEQINREDLAHMEQGGKVVYMFSWIFLVLYQKDGTEWLYYSGESWWVGSFILFLFF